MKSFIDSFRYAFRGIAFAWKGRNFRIELAMALIVIAGGLLLDISKGEWLAIVLVIAGVLGFEAMNSAVEEVVNFISPEFHPLAGRIKDIAAGAVLIVSIASVVIGLIVFAPYLLALYDGALVR